MDRSIIELARERARLTSNTPGSAGSTGCHPPLRLWGERKQTQANAAPPSRSLQLWLATHGESYLYWACALLFATGVLLALPGVPVATPYLAMGGLCHANQ